MVDQPLLATVCADCGAPVSQSRDRRWLHTDELPENLAEHDVSTVIDRQDYLFGTQDRAAKSQAERQTRAMESIADSLRKIVTKMYDR